MTRRTDLSELDAPALAEHREYRHAFECRVHDLIQAQVEEERARGAYDPAEEIEPSAARPDGGR